MEIGYIGLGKMGQNMVARLIESGHTVVAYDPCQTACKHANTLGAETVMTLQELMGKLAPPRTFWMMVPHQVVGETVQELASILEKGDTVIDAGNSPFSEAKNRCAVLEKAGLHFLDVGVSGGPSGARDGACIMVGGNRQIYEKYIPLFRDLAVTDGYAYMGSCGTGHFVKMVHNGIEYGMMQAIAEGFDILRQANFDEPLPLTEIARLYNHGSVIQSRLIGWLESGFHGYGETLEHITGSAAATGEGLWTVEAARTLGIPVSVIEESVNARKKSLQAPSYQGKVISVLRNQFGGHDAAKKIIL